MSRAGATASSGLAPLTGTPATGSSFGVGPGVVSLRTDESHRRQSGSAWVSKGQGLCPPPVPGSVRDQPHGEACGILLVDLPELHHAHQVLERSDHGRLPKKLPLCGLHAFAQALVAAGERNVQGADGDTPEVEETPRRWHGLSEFLALLTTSLLECYRTRAGTVLQQDAERMGSPYCGCGTVVRALSCLLERATNRVLAREECAEFVVEGARLVVGGAPCVVGGARAAGGAWRPGA